MRTTVAAPVRYLQIATFGKDPKVTLRRTLLGRFEGCQRVDSTTEEEGSPSASTTAAEDDKGKRKTPVKFEAGYIWMRIWKLFMGIHKTR